MTLRMRLVAILFLMLVGAATTSVVVERALAARFSRMLGKSWFETALLLSKSVDERIERIESLSFAVMTDSNLQQDLYTISSNALLRTTLSRRIAERLLSFAFSDEAVESITLVDRAGGSYSSGSSPDALPRRLADRAIAIATENNGSNAWMFAQEMSDEVVSVRAVRRTTGLDLSNIGTVIIRVSTRRMMTDALRLLGRSDVRLVILFDGQVVPSAANGVLKADVIARMGRAGFHDILTIGRERVFVTALRSRRQGWSYLALVPYDKVVGEVRLVAALGLGVLVITFAVALLVGIRLVGRVTTPLEKLLTAMKGVESGKFQVNLPPIGGATRLDEIGELYSEFEHMLRRIDTLVNETHKKQLLVKEAEFRALQAQINPHFLYNALESINSVAKVGRQVRIAEMVRSLGNILRSSMGSADAVVTVRQEVELLRDYLRIQSVRFGERLRASVSVSEDVQGFAIPKLTLQPIVENSIQYGLESRPGGTRITVSGRLECDEILSICVVDDGPGMNLETLNAVKEGRWDQRHRGIGLKNIDDRLRMVFGGDYGLLIASRENEGTRVTIRIPAVDPSTLAK